MRFQVFLPPGTTVNSASVRFQVLNSSPQNHDVHAINGSSAWGELSATWLKRTNTDNWQVPGAKGALDRGPAFQSFAMSATGTFILNFQAAGIAMVQSWVNNPSTNRGFVIASDTSTDGIVVASNEHATQFYRPLLTINFTPSGGTGGTGSGGTGTGGTGGIGF